MRVAILLLAACGGGGTQTTGPTATEPPAQLAAACAPDDVQVATVNGRPVCGSCVAGQVMRSKITREQALRECIDFELLAQAAEARGDATAPDVIEATRQTLARRFVDQWEAAHTRDAMRKEIDELYAKGTYADRHVPERRRSYTIVGATKESNATGDALARAYIDKLHDRLANETGLFDVNLVEAAKQVAVESGYLRKDQVADARKIAVNGGKGDGFTIAMDQDISFTSRDDRTWDPAYLGALFALPEIGRISPVIKSSSGYHVILWTDVKPAEEIDYAKAEPRLHEFLQRAAFRDWVEGLKAAHSIDGPHFDRLPAEAP